MPAKKVDSCVLPLQLEGRREEGGDRVSEIGNGVRTLGGYEGREEHGQYPAREELVQELL